MLWLKIQLELAKYLAISTLFAIPLYIAHVLLTALGHKDGKSTHSPEPIWLIIMITSVLATIWYTRTYRAIGETEIERMRSARIQFVKRNWLLLLLTILLVAVLMTLAILHFLEIILLWYDIDIHRFSE